MAALTRTVPQAASLETIRQQPVAQRQFLDKTTLASGQKNKIANTIDDRQIRLIDDQGIVLPWRR
ncbi:hypothetical protein FHU14_000708 [Mesorhizobium sp. RMAD-H1]|nr:hypothetical protein [Mesorhizobium sp. RMAD-H1]